MKITALILQDCLRLSCFTATDPLLTGADWLLNSLGKFLVCCCSGQLASGVPAVPQQPLHLDFGHSAHCYCCHCSSLSSLWAATWLSFIPVCPLWGTWPWWAAAHQAKCWCGSQGVKGSRIMGAFKGRHCWSWPSLFWGFFFWLGPSAWIGCGKLWSLLTLSWVASSRGNRVARAALCIFYLGARQDVLLQSKFAGCL